jgi:hypothetical protein
MHRFGTKNLSEQNLDNLENILGFDSGTNRDPKTGNLTPQAETNKRTIVHTSVNGNKDSIDLDLTQFNDFLLSLSPIIGRRYQVTPKTQKDVIEYIVKYLGGYDAMGGGRIDIQ